MECVLQIFAGPYHQQNYTAQQIIARLEDVAAILPVRKVIIGWFPNKTLYRTVGEWLHGHGMDMLLWLPVFSETGDFVPMTAAVDIRGNAIVTPPLQEGETFSFCCPSDPHNLQAIIDVYETHFADCGFDGVFLDRIRTHSFVGGAEGVLSCGCAHCRTTYQDHGVLLDEVVSAVDRLGDAFFDMDENGRFVCETASAFFDAKGEVIADSVGVLCAYFKAKRMQVGLDVYAPLMSRFVGQNYTLLARHADFIKPMLYRRTNAPAGIAYEYDLLKHYAPTAKGYAAIEMNDEFLAAQARSMSSLPCQVYAGIEVNYRADIAPTDTHYIKESLRVLSREDVDGVTLSWDVMLAPDDHLQAVRHV